MNELAQTLKQCSLDRKRRHCQDDPGIPSGISSAISSGISSGISYEKSGKRLRKFELTLETIDEYISQKSQWSQDEVRDIVERTRILIEEMYRSSGECSYIS